MRWQAHAESESSAWPHQSRRRASTDGNRGLSLSFSISLALLYDDSSPLLGKSILCRSRCFKKLCVSPVSGCEQSKYFHDVSDGRIAGVLCKHSHQSVVKSHVVSLVPS